MTPTPLAVPQFPHLLQHEESFPCVLAPLFGLEVPRELPCIPTLCKQSAHHLRSGPTTSTRSPAVGMHQTPSIVPALLWLSLLALSLFFCLWVTFSSAPAACPHPQHSAEGICWHAAGSGRSLLCPGGSEPQGTRLSCTLGCAGRWGAWDGDGKPRPSPCLDLKPQLSNLPRSFCP